MVMVQGTKLNPVQNKAPAQNVDVQASVLITALTGDFVAPNRLPVWVQPTALCLQTVTSDAEACRAENGYSSPFKKI